MKKITYILAMMAMSSGAYGKVDLSTLPNSDTVQLTIYNSADLTLVRDARSLTVKEGSNQLQFSWANTLIDPTSLEMKAIANADRIEIDELVFPPKTNTLGLWNINSELAGKVPVEISYLTSGLSWRAFYMGTLSSDEKTMHLEGFVRVSNNSGEDYANAQTRLIVGQVHLLDQIAELARRPQPYGNPIPIAFTESNSLAFNSPILGDMPASSLKFEGTVKGLEEKPREIVKEGLSEYFLYTIEGKETIETGWSKRLPSFQAGEVPVVNLYKYEEERYGPSVVRFLSFKNDKDHKLGETPIPDGSIQVFRNADEKQHLSYEGQSAFKYIPVNNEVELNLGNVGDVVVEPKLMKEKTDNFRFDVNGNINGWDEIKEFQIEVRNTRDVAVKIELKRNFGNQYWELANTGDCGKYEKEDLDTVKYTITLEPQSKQTFSYTLHTYQGTRQENWRPVAAEAATEQVKS